MTSKSPSDWRTTLPDAASAAGNARTTTRARPRHDEVGTPARAGAGLDHPASTPCTAIDST